MTQEQRFELIFHYLEKHVDLSVEDACDLCDASPATIRRDFTQLVDQGRVKKTWGGITVRQMATQASPIDQLPPAYRQVVLRHEKQRIAQRAATEVNDGEVVMVGSGTTTMELAPLLADRPIRIITNSLLFAHQLDQHRSQKRGADVFLIGGMLLPDSGVLIGPRTNEELREYYADRAFFSAGGVTPELVTCAHPLIAETERTLMGQCRHVSLLVDHSKMGRREMMRLCRPDELHQFITDNHPDSKALCDALTAQKIDCHYA
ncbi:DeoR family transcriptional regulator, myo-inositol catabolism operon repressor [Catalinimonas alkaloidigena]|uniref:DeoR family transcriptional regulator, myo-inositol catabolism operon repressor n=1 Tax=Catalinimonas alkaloidigena TaxID=1075417 RepID=A0A1G9T6C8_9BACT|nr:DeoR/GlpR family DNA-binding transcription regulator [Catalinimonas alkaloidigena]SDM43186.1 DeoR family transcriptional regulator, myo-inositol catabolism operon repressor [Catalinimonas alkaloidigena]